MSHFEIGPCTPEEYKDSRDNRLQEHELSPESLYTWMALSRIGAAKFPSRIGSIEKDSESGLCIVRFSILNLDLRPVAKNTGRFADGLYNGENNPSERVLVQMRFQTAAVEEGYFKNQRGTAGADDAGEISDEVEKGLQELLDHAHDEERDRERELAPA